jgi:YVTN family beta-propeller protein
VRQEPVGTIQLESSLKPMGQAMTKDGRTLYVSTGRGKKVVAIDTATGNVSHSFEVGARPWGVALSPDGRMLFTANGPSNDVSVVDLERRQVVRTIPVGERPWGVVALAR